MYQKKTSRCYTIIKQFKKMKNITIISGDKLKEVILDIEAIRSGDFDIVDSEDE